MTLESIRSLMSRAPECTVTVLGDFCLDKYLYIDPDLDEPSLETGLTAYQVVGKGIYPGGAGTVTNNLRGLTAKVRCVGIVGEDGEGWELIQALEKIGADTSGMVRDPARCTSTYTKPMRGKPGDYAELNRLDFKNFVPVRPEIEAKIIENLNRCAETSQAVLVLDQFVEEDCGVVNRSEVRQSGALGYLEPGESREFNVTIEVTDDPEGFSRNAGKVLSISSPNACTNSLSTLPAPRT